MYVLYIASEPIYGTYTHLKHSENQNSNDFVTKSKIVVSLVVELHTLYVYIIYDYNTQKTPHIRHTFGKRIYR